MSKPNVGMIGLAVMGSNLARNIERNGYPVAVYNYEQGVAQEFTKKFTGKFVASTTLEDFVSKMDSPRQIFMMIRAGAPVDSVITQLIPLLNKGDIIIDGGNSYFRDTVRREKQCRDAGINFLGVGVSGGEEGALNGPSIMPGGPKEAWQIVAPLFEKMSAKVPEACTAYIGPDGAGHFVKTVHNGIEYGDMQLIAEAYDVLRQVLGMNPEELATTFAAWNTGVLHSFLIEITSKIFKKKDPEGKGYLVDQILDKAGQKGTGMWTAQVALELGVAIPSLSMAVEARILSALKSERLQAAKALPGPTRVDFTGDRKALVSTIHDALYCSKIMAYAQGMALLASASKEWNWDLKLDEISALWKGGCIIRAKFLDQIRAAYKRDRALPNLMLDPALKAEVLRTIPALREIVGLAAKSGIPTIGFAASLNYYDSYRTEVLPQNLTQAQRDFFGAHTYERRDKPGSFHSQWE